MGSLLSVTDSQYIPHWLRELQETGGLSGAHRCPGSPPSPSSTRRSTSAKGTWAKAPKRGWDLSLLRVRRGRGGRSAAQPIAAPVFEDERNRVGQAAARLDLCVTLAVCARDLRTVRDVPLAVAFEDRGEFISHRPFRFLTLHLDFSPTIGQPFSFAHLTSEYNLSSAALLHPPQHLREGDVGEGAEEGIGFELAAGQAGGGEAGQEAGEGSRGGQVRDLPAQGRRAAQARFVQVDEGRRE